ncbi:MAG: cytochrome c biogenesis protein CcsA [Magnetococcales bacterium]|nr:cytochrome c biogenesis protein CcsA [Magnetococcales bacterium]
MIDRLIRFQSVLGWLTLAMLAAGLYLVLTAPADFQQGGSVRILFMHVPSAKMALLCYVALSVASILYLWKRWEGADILSEALTGVGMVFTAVTLASGSIWGKPMWGTWWAWDARLTSMLVLLIIYVGLMALRNGIEDPVKSARATAVLALVGAVDLPIIHFSVKWWRTLHQPASFTGSGAPKIVGPLLTPLVVMAVAFIIMGTYMTVVRARTIRAQRQLEALEEEKSWQDDR